MATRSRGSSIGLIYGLVIFVILFVICLALTFLFYAKFTKADKTRTEAEARNAQIASASEQGTELYQQLLDRHRSGASAHTVYGQLVLDRRSMVSKITGSGDATPEQALAEIKSAGVTEGVTVAGKLQQLSVEVAAKTASLEQIQKDAAARAGQYADLSKQYDELAKAQEATVAARTAEVQAIRTDVTALQQSTATTLDEQTKTYEQSRQRLLDQLRQTEAQAQVKQDEVERLKNRIREMERIFGQFLLEGPRMELEADGVISAVVPQENLVYISLGRADRLILGMKFEVFDAATGIILEEQQVAGRPRDLRGKATIEVVQMAEKSSTCRIVRQAYGSQVVVGDLITNIVYDKARVFKFFVYGNFDLDGDRQATIAEFDQVLSMIRQWGGVAVEGGDRLPLDTDFLVLGDEPEMPRPIDPSQTDPIIITRYQQQLQAVKDYNKLAAQAEALSIPVLNQNRFLTLVGYFNR